MKTENKQVFTNRTDYIKKSNKLKDAPINMTPLENINLTPVSELGINTHVGPSEYSATHV